MPFPLQVILAILGLPESDYPRMLQLTQELFGSSDEELSRGTSMEDLDGGHQRLLRLLHRSSPRTAGPTRRTTWRR